MRSCSNWQLYVIVDRSAAHGRDLAELTRLAIRGGADVIQLRDKHGSTRELLSSAARCLAQTRLAHVPLIINDRADVARAVDADGVHLGQEDLPVAVARDILGRDRIVGKSTHSLEQAIAAEAEGPDYIACGPIFSTPTKPESCPVGPGLITEVVPRVRLPVVCIGGLDQSNVDEVIQAGARCVAVVRAVCAATDPETAARTFKRLLTPFTRPTVPSR